MFSFRLPHHISCAHQIWTVLALGVWDRERSLQTAVGNSYPPEWGLRPLHGRSVDNAQFPTPTPSVPVAQDRNVILYIILWFVLYFDCLYLYWYEICLYECNLSQVRCIRVWKSSLPLNKLLAWRLSDYVIPIRQKQNVSIWNLKLRKITYIFQE